MMDAYWQGSACTLRRDAALAITAALPTGALQRSSEALGFAGVALPGTYVPLPWKV